MQKDYIWNAEGLLLKSKGIFRGFQGEFSGYSRGIIDNKEKKFL